MADRIPNTVFLHCGMHKTGSTSIQRYLMGKRKFFEARGYLIVEDEMLGMKRLADDPVTVNCFGIAHLILRENFGSPIRLRDRVEEFSPSEKQRRIVQVNRNLRELAERNNLIISAEAFSFLRTKEERATYDEMFDGLRIRPLIFLRDEKDWIESWNRQILKLRTRLEIRERLFGSDVEGYEESVFDVGAGSLLGKHETLREFFGPEGTYKDYEDELRRRGSAIPALLEFIGLDPAKCPDYSNFWFNKRVNKPPVLRKRPVRDRPK